MKKLIFNIRFLGNDAFWLCSRNYSRKNLFRLLPWQKHCGNPSLKMEKTMPIERGGIAKYSYKTTEKVGNIVDGSFESYIFSDDESKILLQKNLSLFITFIFRKFDVKDLTSGKIISLNNGNFVQEPKFSPKMGKLVAFISDNNLFYQDLESGKITQITNDGKKNSVINGLGDWVYEEEFGHADFYQWNKGMTPSFCKI